MDWPITRTPAHPARLALLSVLALLAAGCATQANRDTQEATAITQAPLPHTSVAADDGEIAPVPAQPAAPAPETDLWQRIRAGLALPPVNSPYVAEYERWYSQRPEYIEAMVQRARLYLYHIVESVDARGMPMEIALLPAIESAFKPGAYSRAAAAGLWQFIPGTGRRYGLRQTWWYDGRRDVIAATEAALDYLDTLHQEFGDWQLALAAYNAGENSIRKALAENRRRGRSLEYTALRLRPETMRYVPKLMAFTNIVRDPAAYGLALTSIPDKPYFTAIDAGGQIDLGVVARAGGLDIRLLYALNPGYRRWATDPHGPHRVIVPLDNEQALRAALDRLPEEDRMQYARHDVRRGESLGRIASRYGVSVQAIRSANHLPGNLIRAGDSLLVPVASGTKPPAVVVARAGASAPDGRSSVVHTVEQGDTLWAIARRYNVYVHQLANWNGLNTRDVLKLGQPILVWVP